METQMGTLNTCTSCEFTEKWQKEISNVHATCTERGRSHRIEEKEKNYKLAKNEYERAYVVRKV
jgi:hypothetical protein